MKTILGMLLMCAASTQVQAASFDCAKAQSKIEKLICTSEELSRMDEQLSEAYSTALKQAPDPEAFEQRQKIWLKDLRKYCKTSNCLEGAYWARIRALEDGEGGRVYDTSELKIRREADKAAKVKSILSEHPMKLYEGIKGERQVFCQGFYEALRTASSKITYVEPVFRTDDPTHPALGEYLACDLYEPKSISIFAMRDFGSLGFRLYRADMDHNAKNGLEEYLYGQEPETYSQNSTAAYTNINQKCERRDGAGAGPENPTNERFLDVAGVNALVRYKSEYYVYEIGLGKLSKGGHLWAYDSRQRGFRRPPPMQCIWQIISTK